MTIPYHKPLLDKPEKTITEAQLAQRFEAITGCAHAYFTASATNALEVMALALELKPGDEVIMPSFTYAATANAFARQGVKIVFADIEPRTLNIDPKSVEDHMTRHTKAIIPIHYGGVSADVDALLKLTSQRVVLLEDAAHGIGARYKGRPLGTFGAFGCHSFHVTKNITSAGAGGSLLMNENLDKRRIHEIIHQGNNVEAFYANEVNAYSWQRIGGAFEMPQYAMQHLYEALLNLDKVTEKRRAIWQSYHEFFNPYAQKERVTIASVPEEAHYNGHIYYVLLRSHGERDALKAYLLSKGIESASHYEPLHTSKAFQRLGYGSSALPRTVDISQRLLRLPIFYHMTEEQLAYVLNALEAFFKGEL